MALVINKAVQSPVALKFAPEPTLKKLDVARRLLWLKNHRLKNEAGDIYEVPESELDVAVPALGLQPASDEDVAAYDVKKRYSKPTEKLKAIGYGGLRVGSLGLVDYAFPEYAKTAKTFRV